MKIGDITLSVKDFDKALQFYVEKISLVNQQDIKFWGDNRWVPVSPKDHTDLELAFVKADTEEKLPALGDKCGH
jgi:hypothetical protein